MNQLDRNSTMRNPLFKYSWIWYDRFLLDNTLQDHLLFTVPKGQDNKTLEDTNMVLGGQIPKGKSFDVMGISIQIQQLITMTAAIAEAYWAMVARTTLEFQVDSKDTLFTCNLQHILGASGPGVINTAAVNIVYAGSTGKSPGYLPLNVPIGLSESDAFSIKVRHQTAHSATLNGLKICVSLHGVGYRVTG